MATGPGVWTRWWQEEGSLKKKKKRHNKGDGVENISGDGRTLRRTLYRWPGTPWWRCVPPPPSCLWCWPKPPALQDLPPQKAQPWSLLFLHCFQPGRCKLPSPLDGPQATEKRRPLMFVTPFWGLVTILHPGSYTFVCFHLDDIGIIGLLSNQLEGGALAFPGHVGAWPASGTTLHRYRVAHPDPQGPWWCQPYLRCNWLNSNNENEEEMEDIISQTFIHSLLAWSAVNGNIFVSLKNN